MDASFTTCKKISKIQRESEKLYSCGEFFGTTEPYSSDFKTRLPAITKNLQSMIDILPWGTRYLKEAGVKSVVDLIFVEIAVTMNKYSDIGIKLFHERYSGGCTSLDSIKSVHGPVDCVLELNKVPCISIEMKRPNQTLASATNVTQALLEVGFTIVFYIH
eukprot:TRINITY_DN3565_c0_g1_i1.p1 TRINITY_DN3565_c0_g1~~TRINITY_DN3565_c0_g1_i1.p1  ORF type:complete len:161 (-),score=19.93 TRINITY_DN3565_c0_g1_i1:472-954(-)